VPTTNAANILKRIDELLAIEPRSGQQAQQLPPACVGLLSLVYGPDSPQLKYFNSRLSEIQQSGGASWKLMQASVEAHHVLANVKREIESGLTGSLKHQITSEVLSDFIELSRSILNEPSSRRLIN
jgi:hypothetical protein